ncbi:MAG: hypothetical protein WA989_14135 [Henriciella sp.]|uniref:hypothetical protein n=1 Tax=Henriciella sp. TaxID=1968823 RepID=UPI003C78ADCE
MKLDPKSAFSPEITQGIPADPVFSFINAHQEVLWHAARLLGGYESARLVDRCVELLGQDQRVRPRTTVMLGQILSLLSLDNVDDPDLPYMAHFAVIDPRDPVVEEICLLTDGLRHALAQADAEPKFRTAA